VDSLNGFRLVLFLSKLNGMKLCETVVGSAYLEAFTSNMVLFIPGPELADLEGQILVIIKALYVLHSNGSRWHDRFADCIMVLGFLPF
jgi:hypothetical protein